MVQQDLMHSRTTDSLSCVGTEVRGGQSDFTFQSAFSRSSQLRLRKCKTPGICLSKALLMTNLREDSDDLDSEYYIFPVHDFTLHECNRFLKVCGRLFPVGFSYDSFLWGFLTTCLQVNGRYFQENGAIEKVKLRLRMWGVESIVRWILCASLGGMLHREAERLWSCILFRSYCLQCQVDSEPRYVVYAAIEVERSREQHILIFAWQVLLVW